ncbi:putative colanic acid biosynthesis acetyltransferase [Allopontixanthobacter sp.]|uniref:putative colanic acid biosynthesis acetyltransferase n=1 Tax=Allopontixanthobacter sp. TaxID=2906452 RepID=UPI002AB824CA|nr:putative colanic acid biosynthesis acetyltransferase [Allopontixanthobacter sp.]MDZ4307492.1 putative colanic acid biosynthesis acetyltransferase [Allopontixanthobacter sp.]
MSPLDARTSRPLEGGASFSLGNRMARAAWALAWLLLARWTPPPVHGWRRLVLIAFGAKVGPGARVYASTKVWFPANLELGANALIGPRVTLYNQGRIVIGRRSVVSQGAHICASSHDIRDPHFQLVLRPVTLGEDCWVAAEAFVGPGVTMADGCVLAARGALFENGDAWAVYRGNPAAAIKPRERLAD